MTAPIDQNPLVAIRFRIPFDQIRAEHVEPAVRHLIARSQDRMHAIASHAGPRTFENTVAAYEAMTDELDYATTVVEHLESVATTPEIRAAYSAVQAEVSEFYSSIALSQELWGALKAYAGSSDAKALTGARRRFLDKTVEFFKRSGADLDADARKRLAEIDVELGRLALKFSQNVVDATGAFELVLTDAAQLAGLPPSAVDAARQSAEGRGLAGWRFTLQAPSYIPVMTYLDDASVREKLYRAYNTRATGGATDNRAILLRLLELRHEKARLLGYEHFADFVLEDRMLKTGDAAETFLRTLRDRCEPAGKAEADALLAFRRERDGAAAPELEPWDVTYYAEKQRRARYDFDAEALRPYFSADRVMAGAFLIAEKLYGLTFEKWDDAPTWHPDVTAYKVLDAERGWIGGFYLDLYPRESKRDGAWMHGLLNDVDDPDHRGRHLAVLAANVTPPVGDKPALLTHPEVQTVFHEFGHLMHHMLSRVEIRSLAGTRVARDFVELPSMIMENWTWERDALALFAKHCATGEVIPDAEVDRLRRARNFRVASAMMRQLGFAATDLALHMHYRPARDGDVVAYSRRLMQEYSAAKFPEDHAMIAAFTHLFANPVGYAAGYYSYTWSSVLEADAFSRFRREGILSREVGGEFRAKILARGNADEPLALYRDFMGREPDLTALLERSELVTDRAA